MALPLIAAGIAARAVAKKIAKNAAGTAARTRINSAAAAKVVAPKKLKGSTAKAKPYNFPGRTIKIDSNPKPVVKPAIFLSRTTSGITGAGAKQVTPVYRNMNTSNVKVLTNVKAQAKDLGISKKVYQKTANNFMTDMVKSTKSGKSAKEVAALRQVENTFGKIPKKPTVKINSNPTRNR
jgi:hypothetical protein